MRNSTGGSADVCPQAGGQEDDAAFPSSIQGRAPCKARAFVVCSSSESPGSAGCPVSFFPQWLDPVLTHGAKPELAQ